MTRFTRRELLAGAAALATAGSMPRHALAQSGPSRRLAAVTRTIEVNGRAAKVFGLSGGDGRPGLTFDAGERFSVGFRNETGERTLIHWHGMTPPWQQDGVPGLTGPLVEDGGELTYDFPITRPGTNWMHAHTLQEQALLAAPLIIRDPAEKGLDEQEVVVIFHDFSFRPAEELLQGLAGPGAGMHQGGDMAGMMHGSASTAHGGVPMPGMNMDAGMAMDVNDIDYDAFLANDRTLDDPEIVRTEKGGRIRLRLVNGSATTAYTIDLGSLVGELVAVDGMPVRPVTGSRFPFAVAQRLDIRLRMPVDGGACPVLALREGAIERSGFFLAPPGASVGRLPVGGNETAPLMGLDLEARLRSEVPLAERPANRRYEMLLAGSMTGYRWAIEGLPSPFVIGRGERVEVVMRNASMMSHPMHLHGHHFQVVEIDGTRVPGAVRDTVLVPPMREVTVAFDADNPGKWAFHCHHLYHMAVGMMVHMEYRSLG